MTDASPPAATLRSATLDDLLPIRSILAAHGTDGPIVIADIVGPYLSHLIARGRAHVAVINDEIVGFGAAIDAGRAVHLADLFVAATVANQGPAHV